MCLVGGLGGGGEPSVFSKSGRTSVHNVTGGPLPLIILQYCGVLFRIIAADVLARFVGVSRGLGVTTDS